MELKLILIFVHGPLGRLRVKFIYNIIFTSPYVGQWIGVKTYILVGTMKSQSCSTPDRVSILFLRTS